MRRSSSEKCKDYVQEQETKIEALQAILMDEIKGGRYFQIILSPEDDDEDESTDIPVHVALTFSHIPNYPDEPRRLGVKSLQGMRSNDLKTLREKLEQEALENLGMTMIYTLVTLAKEWLTEKYSSNPDFGDEDDEDTTKDDVITPHGEIVTVETFLAWREHFEAKKALEHTKLIPNSTLTTPKEKKLTGQQWFESGAVKGSKTTVEDFENDEEDMLEYYLTEKSEGSSHRKFWK